MKNIEKINFKYRTPTIANGISFIFFIIYLIIIYLIIKISFTTFTNIILIIIATILTIILLCYICPKLSILSGKFEFKKNNLTYSTLNKTYIIRPDEIEYISKESYIDYSNIFNIEKYIYKIKIKNAKSFIFSYYDDSLVNAIEALSNYYKIKIDDVT